MLFGSSDTEGVAAAVSLFVSSTYHFQVGIRQNCLRKSSIFTFYHLIIHFEKRHFDKWETLCTITKGTMDPGLE